MKECPQCGYVDEPYWRSTYNRKKGEDYTHISNFEIMFGKEAADKLRANKRLHIKPYNYRLTKWGNVIRSWEKWTNTSTDYEKHIAHVNNPNQTKLTNNTRIEAENNCPRR